MLRALLLLICAASICHSQQPTASKESQRAVALAINDGVRYLLDDQLRDGSWSGHRPKYPTGQTAFTVYTLLNCGVPVEHPSIRRALSYLEHREPRRTYSVSNLILALAATNDPAHLPRIEALVERLLEWRTGGWMYPGVNAKNPNDKQNKGADLSNTQFALMALRAARLSGVEISVKTMEEVLTEVFRFQWQHRGGGSKPKRPKRGEMPAAVGFTYYLNGRVTTGSMTAAGIACVRICQDALGSKLSKKLRAQADFTIQSGLAWLDENWTVEENPAPNASVEQFYKIFYLYSLERVGALLNQDLIGEHDWYEAGARELVRMQADDGSWDEIEVRSDTCFALLFLTRSTRAQKFSQAKRADSGAGGLSMAVHDQFEQTGPVRIQAVGDPVAKIWVSEIEGTDLHIESVDYLVDGEVIATVPGVRTRKWSVESFPIQHTFERRGTYLLDVRVHLDGDEVLEGTGCRVTIQYPFAPWMLSSTSASFRNLLFETERTPKASSIYGVEYDAASAFDGREESAWVCDESDEKPTLHVQFKKKPRANRIVLNQCVSKGADLGKFGRILEVELTINLSKNRIVIPMEPDIFKPTIYILPKKTSIRSLTILVTRRDENVDSQAVGFSEIALEYER
ncbi:MAG: hypothetical protein ACI8TQ_001345 [Planctomycetota bacterium]|jgi:hypothetical protein